MKERKYADARMRGLSKEDAYAVAGYDVNDVVLPGFAIEAKERRLRQSSYVQEVANRHGLTIDVFMIKLAEGLDATVQKEYMSDGQLIQGVPKVDHKTRLTALRQLGAIHEISRPDDDDDRKGGDTTINILAISDKYAELSPEELKKQMQRVKLGRSARVMQAEDIVEIKGESEDIIF